MTTAFRAKALSERLKPLHTERDDRLRRGVPVPPWVTSAIATIEGQLANQYHIHEVEENLPEAEFMALQEPRTDEGGWWRWYLAGAAVCLALATWIRWGWM